MYNKILTKGLNMKKIIHLAVLLALLVSLSACMGERGYVGSQKVCKNQAFLGISIIEIVSPCSR